MQVDPDVIRYELPEMEGYLERDRTAAGSQTHKEAGFIQEILTLEGLQLGKNVIVDGSLHDADWNSLFARIRKEHPNVKIAIVHVSCDPSRCSDEPRGGPRRRGVWCRGRSCCAPPSRCPGPSRAFRR